jgi:DNA-directed RNA polymerase specialized sigma24 family protein
LASVVEGFDRARRSHVLIRWRTVVKHEAMAIRSSRVRLLGGADAELDAREAVEVPGPSERATDRERAHRALAALATLKRDEARALVLQAAGRTYAEIEAETGWSHTKVNRALTEGRAAFRTLVSALEAGDECARHAPLLPALARGRAPADAIVPLRAHLRACGPCRARLAELRQ